MSLRIVRATEDILEKCSALENKYLKTPWSVEDIRTMTPEGTYLAAVDENEVVGICSFYLVCGELQIVNLAVEEKYRKNKIGSRLLEKAMEQDFSVCTLEVGESNLIAIAFYEKLGFKSVGKRKNFYKNEDAKIMLLEKGNENDNSCD